jgi:predicted dehydrogenase
VSNLSRRQLLAASALSASVYALGSPAKASTMANEEINMGFISCGGRAGEHMKAFSNISGVKYTGLCDPDEKRSYEALKKYPGAKTYNDLRRLLDDKETNAVVVATSNHWHCLASIWAMQAGKHVYVEKPLSHNQWEGKQTVLAAKKYNKVCAIGTQQRSDPMQAEIKKFLHEEKVLGKINYARVNRFGVRGSIGKRAEPLVIPPEVGYDLWLGPAQDLPIYRNNLQYDWHWVWNTGSGEMGNWGVHILDDVRNNVFQDKVSLPKQIYGGGGRVVWDDAGETPNVQFAYFDTGMYPVVIALTNLPDKPGDKKGPKCEGPGNGYLVSCEGGRLEGQRGSATAFDKNGKEIKKFKGTSGNTEHHENFIEAVRKGDNSLLNADVKVGHDSTGWCNVANIAYQAGTTFSKQAMSKLPDPLGIFGDVVADMEKHLGNHGVKIESESIKLSPLLTLDPVQEVFVGEHAETANKFLKREYRAPYTVPDMES